MRFLGPNGELDLNRKNAPDNQSNIVKPWFSFPHQLKKTRLLFGHWAALNGVFNHPNVIGLDTGCVWGGPLTLLHVETNKRYRQAL